MMESLRHVGPEESGAFGRRLDAHRPEMEGRGVGGQCSKVASRQNDGQCQKPRRGQEEYSGRGGFWDWQLEAHLGP